VSDLPIAKICKVGCESLEGKKAWVILTTLISYLEIVGKIIIGLTRTFKF
jgi:hypothetical protein